MTTRCIVALIAAANAATHTRQSFKSSFISLGGVKHHIRDTGEVSADGPVSRFARKYTDPIDEFPDSWDKALLNVYRADQSAEETGRRLLADAKDAAGRFLVITGDSDFVVPVRSSRKVADLLDAELRELAETGHLPMDEKPADVAALLLDFMVKS